MLTKIVKLDFSLIDGRLVKKIFTFYVCKKDKDN